MKKKNISLIITSIFMIVIVASASYSYFNQAITIDSNVPVTAMFSSVKPVFIAKVDKNINLQINTTDMVTPSATPRKSDNGIIKVELTAGSNNSITCTYDIDYVWDSGDYNPTHTLPVVENNVTYNYELSLSGTRTTTGDSGYTYANKNLSEINIDKLSWSNAGTKTAKLVNNAEIHNQSSTTPTITTWTFTMKFYSLPTKQNGLLYQNYQGHLVISDTRC